MKNPILVFIVLLCALNGALVYAHYHGGITPGIWSTLRIGSRIIECGLGSVAWYHVWKIRLRNRFAYYYAIALLGLVAEALCTIIGSIVVPQVGGLFPIWYANWTWTGQLIEGCGLTALVLFQLGFLNGKGHHQ